MSSACWTKPPLGPPRMGPSIFSSPLLLRFGFYPGTQSKRAGYGQVYSPLRMTSGPIQHFRSAFFTVWQKSVASALCKRKGFGRAPVFHMFGPQELLTSSHLREINMLLRAMLSGGVLDWISSFQTNRFGHPMSFLWSTRWGWSPLLGTSIPISTVPVGPEVSFGMDGFLDSHVELETLVG